MWPKLNKFINCIYFERLAKILRTFAQFGDLLIYALFHNHKKSSVVHSMFAHSLWLNPGLDNSVILEFQLKAEKHTISIGKKIHSNLRLTSRILFTLGKVKFVQ